MVQHAWRADGHLIKNVLVNKINKIKLLKRPKTQWIDVVAKDLLIINQNAPLEIAYQKDRWKDFDGIAGPECSWLS